MKIDNTNVKQNTKMKENMRSAPHFRNMIRGKIAEKSIKKRRSVGI